MIPRGWAEDTTPARLCARGYGPKAEVLRVEVGEAEGEFSGFEQRPSA